MGNRSDCHITVGGALSAAHLPAFIAAAQDYLLSTEWDEPPLEADQLPDEGPLDLYGRGLNGGYPADFDQFCRDHGLHYRRWSGGCGCEYPPEVAIHAGNGLVHCAEANENEIPLITFEKAEQLGSMKAIRAHFRLFDLTIPAFKVIPSIEGDRS